MTIKISLGKSSTLALAGALMLMTPSNAQYLAQVPGIPNPGSQPPIFGTPDSGQVLTGRVKHDIMPAEKLLSQGKYVEAEGTFREALVNNPTDMQATVGLGIALAKQFKLDGADEQFDRVLQNDPNNALAYAGKATIQLNRLQSSSGSVRAMKDSYLKQAEDYARRAVQLSPAAAEAHYALGCVLKEQGKVDEASSEFRNAVNFDPQHSYAYSALGQCKLDAGSLAEAQQSFQQAINLNSGNSSAHFGLGATLLKQGSVDDAIKELNISLYQFPNSWPTRMMLGQAYQTQGNSVAAINEYQKSTMIKPENAEPYIRMADIRMERGDLELALADLRSGLTQIPYNLDLRMRIADTTLKLEKPDDAIKNYRMILSMSPNNPQAVKGLSQALYQKAQKAAVGALLASNDYDTAIKTLDEAIKLNPVDMELQLAKSKLTSLSGIKPDLSTMSQPTNDGERIAYAEALQATGDFAKASDMIKQVLNDQTDPKQTYAVADIALMVKDLDNAEAAYKKGLTLGGSADRSTAGLAKVTQSRATAVEENRVANELSKKNQFDGAISKYRNALAANPTLADARYGLGRALEKSKNPNSAALLEAVQQYDYYLNLRTDMPSKDREKMVKDNAKLKEKALKQKEKEAKKR
ncbi:MAG: tetratricopeptide repeat protein [Candidatus Obscuribacter sp.]|nr:tetratricopeptide repeat protein [Candidatus Obscuribacter sp.]